MKIKLFLTALFVCMALSSVSLSGCSVGGHVGPVGGGAAVG